jgi:hypothetical protein
LKFCWAIEDSLWKILRETGVWEDGF